MNAAAIRAQALAEVERALLYKQADRARRDFYTFFRLFAWPVLEPHTPYVDNWHVGAICEHLTAISNSELHRLIINMPFRLLKSTLCSQAWPAWEWIVKPHTQWLTSSYAKELSMKDAVASRRIIESPAYQACFCTDWCMTSDQNVKTRYENSARGSRIATSTDAAATGFGGNRILIDDALSAKQADQEIERNKCIEWFKGTISTRFNNPTEDAAVLVAQRLHENDLPGYLLREQPGVWEHLNLPMRYESKRTIFVGGMQQEVDTKSVRTKIGFVDPRTVEGELLCPARLPEATVREIEATIGAYHTQAQLQQHPSSRGGVIFARNNWKFYKALPQIEEKVISVDCTFKDTTDSDYVAIQVIGRAGANKYLIKRMKERLSFSATVNAVKAIYAAHSDAIAVLIEDKANGTAVIESIKLLISGVIPIEPDGGKVARAYAIQPQHEAGNFWLPDPSIEPQIDTFISELSAFPNGINDDEVDAWTQGVNWYAKRERNMGILDFYKAEAEALKQLEHA